MTVVSQDLGPRHWEAPVKDNTSVFCWYQYQCQCQTVKRNHSLAELFGEKLAYDKGTQLSTDSFLGVMSQNAGAEMLELLVGQANSAQTSGRQRHTKRQKAIIHSYYKVYLD